MEDERRKNYVWHSHGRLPGIDSLEDIRQTRDKLVKAIAICIENGDEASASYLEKTVAKYNEVLRKAEQ